jgi:integrase
MTGFSLLPLCLVKKPYHGWSMQDKVLRPAGVKAGISGPVRWHSLRHGYRTWLDETGAPIRVQRGLMRHSSSTMTMDGYGRGVAKCNREANEKVVSVNQGNSWWTVTGL